MNRYSVVNIAKVVGTLSALEISMSELRNRQKEVSRKVDPSLVADMLLDESTQKVFGKQMLEAHEKMEAVKLINGVPFIERAAERIGAEGATIGTAESEFHHAREGIIRELEKWSFVPIPPEHVRYFECALPFGITVSAKFPASEDDIRDAGNCIAVELPTAAIFHLMRVAEHGLRYLAKKLGVRLTDKGKHQPIEFATWDKVITGAKNKLATHSKLPHGPKRQHRMSTYSDAADHCLYMKDIWRNNASHTHTPYKLSEAMATYERVRDFMNFLAVNL